MSRLDPRFSAGLQLQSHFESHGESSRNYLDPLSELPQHTEDPILILFDEPEAGLDYSAKLELTKLLRGLAAQSTQAIISTHEPLLFLQPDVNVISLDQDPDYISKVKAAYRESLE